MTDTEQYRQAILAIRRRKPLIHCITNYVAMQFNADALLALGASPLMSFCKDEMEDIASITQASVINIGCLDRFQIEGMKAAVEALGRRGRKWVLDPVGAGASSLRTQTALTLIREGRPAVIRANASEIMALAGARIDSRGADSTNDVYQARTSAMTLASESGAVVSVSGEADLITDGVREEFIEGGSPVMCEVTGMGCTATALTGAFLTVCGSPFEAAAYAMRLMAECGGKAAEESSGSGSFRVRFLDELYNIYRTEK